MRYDRALKSLVDKQMGTGVISDPLVDHLIKEKVITLKAIRRALVRYEYKLLKAKKMPSFHKHIMLKYNISQDTLYKWVKGEGEL